MFHKLIILLLVCNVVFAQNNQKDSINTSIGSSITGILVSSDGSPAIINPLDIIEVQLFDASMRKRTTTIIKSDGSFSFENIDSGEYVINIPHFYDHPVTVSLGKNESMNIGKQRLLYYGRATSDVLFITSGSAPFPQELDSQYPVTSTGHKVLTVCEYLKMRAEYPLAYPENKELIIGEGVIIIGNLAQTPEGSWLRQSCENTVKAGEHTWPDAIFLNDSKAPKQSVDRYAYELKEADHRRGKEFIQNNNDGDSVSVAVIGELTTSDNLVYVKCGEEKTCGFGYGPVAAPAQITYWSMRHLTGDVDLLK